MAPRRHAGQPPQRSSAFNPWAPRTPGAPPAARPSASAPTTGGSGTWAARPQAPTFGGTPPTAPPSAQLGGRAPVADDARPSGAPSVPPTAWPDPFLPAPEPGAGEPKRRSAALWAFTAFLLGAALVGAVLAAYAAGDSRDDKAAASTTTTAPLRAEGDLDIQKILDKARPSVVTIQTGGPTSLFGSAGTGVIISEDGLILTNAHVIEGAGGEDITVRFNDGTSARAKLVGASTGDDIALIQAEQTALTPAKLGSSANLLVGDPVVAIGNALNLGGDPSVTSGIVSAKDRQISDGSISLDNLIQTDAAINPGNSGGPLVNANGEVVGINTAIIQGAQNIGFSIAIDSVQELIDDLKAGGGDLTPNTPVLGITTVDVSSPDIPPEFKDQFGITAEQGAIVGSVAPKSGAGKAGIQIGDVVVGFDGKDVTGSTQLTKLVREHKPGDEVTVEVERRGEPKTFTVTIGP